jgi:hypothetical protein
MAAVKKDIGGTNLISGAENYLQHYNSIFFAPLIIRDSLLVQFTALLKKKKQFFFKCRFFNHDARLDFVYIMAGRSKEINVNVV